MILTERQKYLIKELLLEDGYVPTKFLASKFNVSLRTIRYDLENIEYFIKENGSQLIKSPKKGIMIINKKPIQYLIEKEGINNNHILLSQDKRKIVASLVIIMKSDYVTSEELSNKLQVSKSTALSIIKDINDDLEDFHIMIKGRPNYGYKFVGKEKDIRNYILNKIIPFIIENELIESLYDYLLIDSELEIKNITTELKGVMQIKLSYEEEVIIGLRIIFFVIRNLQQNIVERDIDRIKKYKNTNVYKNIELFYKTLVDKFEIKYHEEEIVYLTRILIECNSFTSVLSSEEFNSLEDEEKLMDVVAEMVELCYQHIKINENEVEVLVNDLILHLRGTLKRIKLHIKAENIILEAIKAKYGDIFIIAKQMGIIFEKHYGIELSDDEIGFITMYVCKGIENSRVNVTRNILVVCNTGRGAAKLLATRIKNNIPEINIARVVSMIDLEDVNQLDNIDLVISTLKLPTISKKVIVVSPIITSYELSSIREYLYLKDNNFINSNAKLSMEDEITSILSNYISKIDSYDVMEDLVNIFKRYSSKTVYYSEKLNVSFWEYTAMILVEIGEMLTKIYENDISKADFKKIIGVFVHITMAIPRWQSKDFIIEQNMKFYKDTYPKKYKIIDNSLKTISKMYNIPIKETEIIPILRYLL